MGANHFSDICLFRLKVKMKLICLFTLLSQGLAAFPFNKMMAQNERAPLTAFNVERRAVLAALPGENTVEYKRFPLYGFFQPSLKDSSQMVFSPDEKRAVL